MSIYKISGVDIDVLKPLGEGQMIPDIDRENNDDLGNVAAQVVEPDLFRDGIRCAHMEDNPKMRPHRLIRAGKDRWFLLCDYCSGLLVETVLTEFKSK